ncbi:MAG: transcription-repair coupling factor [Clostridia bacterium]|nr:transcription-repair coupling factor [Clostridia bacterium]
MNTIIGELGKSPKFVSLVKNIENTKSPIEISGLTDVAETSIIAGINEFTKRPVLLVTYNEVQARKLAENIKYFTEKVYVFPKKEILTYDYVAESKDLPYERIDVLNKIYDNKNIIVVTTIEAIEQKILSKAELYKNTLNFEIGKRCNIDEIKQKLVDLGYARYELIDARGEFSIRGGIIDISISDTTGVRIELWGDEVDSIRYFNIVSQRSTSQIDKIEIYPAHEFILEKSLEDVCNNIQSNVYESNKQQIVEKDIEEIKNGNYLSKVDRYFNSFYSNQETLLDYLNERYIVFVDEQNKIEARSLNIKEDTERLIKALIEKEKIVPESLLNTATLEDTKIALDSKKVIYVEKLNTTTKSNIEKFNLKYRQLNYYKSGIDLFINDIKNFQKDKKKIYVVVDMKEKANKIEKLLSENDISSRIEENLNQTIITKNTQNNVVITIGKLSEGFESYDLEQIVIVANELVEADRRKRKYKSEEFKQGEKVVFADLKVGDYVVHKNYGIGIYIGVNTITADGTTKDYIKLKYAGDDVLYIPTDALDSIRKYVGGEDAGLKLNKLGSKDWERTKTKVKNNLRAVAKELIELYARREKSRGHAFAPDTEWQKEFEGRFPYVETDDQLRCIEEVKTDMENEKPMDRLLCGDVGYGKTEVAIRAAFKSVMEGKQVAYLVPTTVLAKQQYQTFKERMKDYPITVELLNRFRTTKDKNRVVKELKLGDVDIVVGTHKLLGKEVEFKDLGLLIIDEEHRFGVKAKEKIKQYKANIDVLTMTATPIPRTLHMSVVGVRDMSVIYEPPQNRKPVQTYVLEYDEEVIKEAITKELERDGQVFYIYNKVEDIMLKADAISRLVPEARVGFAHGRMTGSEIEEIMQDFVDKKINVLVCTTILESGIDIPNANTIIVENADRMGLAQLYQIRGRVGRSDRQGYAYITYKKDKVLAEEADKRLKAIKEFTEFGSGFKIAMRDLEIRGAGSLIGEIQHGHLEEVGYDTYCRLLDEVVKEEQGIEVKPEFDVQIDLNVTSFIPESYISDSNQKIEIYQDIALCKDEKDIQDVIDELIDRFGDIPKEVEKLLEISRIKQLAKAKGVSKISSKKEAIVFTYDNSLFDDSCVQPLIKEYGNRIRFSPGVKPMITLKIANNSEETILKEVKEFLTK